MICDEPTINVVREAKEERIYFESRIKERSRVYVSGIR
jgi:hypothetical protein